MRYFRVTPPATTPVSLGEAKAHLRVDFSDDDDLIGGLIAAATELLDGRAGLLGRAMITQDWRVETSAPECGKFRIDLPDVQSISSIEYLVDGVAQVVASTDYRLGYDGMSGIIMPAGGAAWSSADLREDAWRVSFVAGYGAAAAVPAPIRQAIKLLVGHWYATREPVTVGNVVSSIPFTIEMLFAPYKTFF